MILSANRRCFNSQAPLPSHSQAGSVAASFFTSKQKNKDRFHHENEHRSKKQEDEEPPSSIIRSKKLKKKTEIQWFLIKRTWTRIIEFPHGCCRDFSWKMLKRDEKLDYEIEARGKD